MNLKDLAKDSISEKYRFELTHPVTGEGLGAFIHVVSAKSDRAQAFFAKQLRKEQKRELENARTRHPKFKELDEIKDESIELALNRMVGWENVEFGDKKELPFTEENARMLLKECDWMIEQILEHSNDLGKFLKH
ncbi:hypothetical protein [Actinobacillus porcinus]|uniref:hypothetical protein n=1 Tax=Actinobacillus porcinus TaxID=51048 RepID=UPI0023F3D68D|nr:hypothetical protein [Actinobacillus porcinus]MDD7545573.1 hypothetical protein [Actinobacillus porcinus]MDY5847634.1 hypothetical protein [Actinobacillus porcinus]